MTATLYKHGNYSGWAKEFKGPVVFCDLNNVEGAEADHASALKVQGESEVSERFVGLNLKTLKIN